jgi:hypothetical protein
VAEQPRAALAGGALIGLGLLFVVCWDLVVFPSIPPRTDGSLGGQIGQSVLDLGRLSREAVGVFGWLDVTPPAAVYLGWGALVVAVVAVACLLGRRFDRRVLAALVIAVVALGLFVSAYAYVQQGTAQGRWILPAAVALPLVAGEVLARRWPAGEPAVWPTPRASVVACGAAVATLQGLSLWANARRYAVGIHGPLMFLGESRWAPPGGWWPVAAFAAAGLAAIVAGAARVATTDPRRVDPARVLSPDAVAPAPTSDATTRRGRESAGDV